MALTNTQLQAALQDLVEEVSLFTSSTVWKSYRATEWLISDEDNNRLGTVRVDCICRDTGNCTLKYRADHKYGRIRLSVDINPRNLTDAEERQKFMDFDSDIADEHGI